MKRSTLPGAVDIIRVDEPRDIRILLNEPALDRVFQFRWPLFNALLISRVIGVLSFRGRRFPTLQARDEGDRARRQDVLWKKLNLAAKNISVHNPDIEALAHWVRDGGEDAQIGILSQQIVGRLFLGSYQADRSTWESASILASAVQAQGMKALTLYFSRKLRSAKSTLAARVDGDLAAVHATGIAVHNIVKGFRRMRQLYESPGLREALSADAATRECLYAPTLVLRQATAAGVRNSCPFRKGTVFMLELAAAQRKDALARDLIFLDETWSRCPADTWVPALLGSVWTSATSHHT